MPHPSDRLPGNGFLGWLGRQIGHVAKAVKTDVTPPPDSKIVYRECTIEEKASPVDPNLKFRRTVIDEIVEKNLNRRDAETHRKQS
jgi:hypothetical protein